MPLPRYTPNTGKRCSVPEHLNRLLRQWNNKMLVQLLKSKIHRATVTCANLNYQGSITIDQALCQRAGIFQWERVDIYNVTTGARLSTYVIYGESGEITLNGAAARCVQPGDKIIIATYAMMDEQEASSHKPTIILVDENNQEITEHP